MKEIIGVQVSSIENFLLGFAVFFLVLYLITLCVEKKPHWFFSKNLRQCLTIEEKFQKLTNSRRDILHHYYWARSEGDQKKMKDMNKDLTRVDLEIQKVREEYHQKKSTLTKIVQKLM